MEARNITGYVLCTLIGGMMGLTSKLWGVSDLAMLLIAFAVGAIVMICWIHLAER